MGTTGLGRYTRRGAGILTMGVSGGAVFPPIQGAIADAYSTRISFLVPMVGFIIVFAYALFHWIKHGFKVRRISPTVDVHVISTADEKRVSTIISQETVDAMLESQRKSSQRTATENRNQTIITTENL
jgi:FHS family L-fucose permease-like MFS transporter